MIEFEDRRITHINEIGLQIERLRIANFCEILSICLRLSINMIKFYLYILRLCRGASKRFLFEKANSPLFSS